MASYKVEALPVGRNLIGEGPHWDASTQELLYVDIYGKSVHRYNPATGVERKIVIEGGEFTSVSFVIPVQSQPNKYLITHGGSIRVLEWPATGEKVNVSQLKTLHSVPAHDPPATINDAKCDAKGRLWTGSLCVRVLPSGWEVVKGVGKVFRLDTDAQFTVHVDGVDLSNGIAWSPDNKQFYFNDTNANRVDGWDYDLEKGTLSNRRTVFDFKTRNIEGMPDGMCTDSDGNLWVAMYDGGKVVQINPRTGELLGTIDFQNKKITSCTFGGPNLDVLYVTSGCFQLSAEEIEAMSAGSTYKVTGLGVKGASAGVAYAGKV